MPVTPTYPGVYIEEVASGVHTITGVATSITAFIGRARRGPADIATTINSFADYERIFGGLWSESMMSYAVNDFFANGGSQAIIVRVHNGAAAASINLTDDANPANTIPLKAASPGDWGEKLLVRVDYNTRDPSDTTLYNLSIRDTGTGAEERYLNVSTSASSPRSLDKVLQSSNLVSVTGAGPFPRPVANKAAAPGTDPFADTTPPDANPANNSFVTAQSDGSDGNTLSDAQFQGSRAAKTGIYALLDTDLFNLLVIPPISRAQDVGVGTTLTDALNLCVERRAMLIVDSPSGWDTVANAVSGIAAFGLKGNNARNAALYFPRIRKPDPLQENNLDTFASSGAVAGVIARTDAQRGVWKAPAGLEASLNGVSEFVVKLSDAENGQLNPLGINCLRSFAAAGRVVWGARTLQGDDRLASEWKYVPVRRLALYLEESLYRGTQWVVFEPNDEPLWAQIRLNIGAFMQTLFQQGAFQGKTPREAYFVKCDKDTTTQNDINSGIVNIVVGFAPLKPAEFVIIKIEQMAGQIQV